jgi:hypothetical protein
VRGDLCGDTLHVASDGGSVTGTSWGAWLVGPNNSLRIVSGARAQNRRKMNLSTNPAARHSSKMPLTMVIRFSLVGANRTAHVKRRL